MHNNNNHYALVVGIDHYPEYRNLNGAKTDAESFVNWLTNTDTGGGLPDANVKLILSEVNTTKPIHEDIDDKLEDIFNETKDTQAKRIYIYFSGHGLSRTKFTTDLCLARWSKHRKGTCLDSQDYLELITESGQFGEVIMLLDCCRVRMIRKRALPPTIDFPRPGEGAQQSRYFLANATEFLNTAHEATTNINFDEDDDDGPIVRGHFTQALLEALNGKAAQSQGGVTVTSLKRYLQERTQEIAKAAGHVQKPEFNDGMDSSPEAVFGYAMPFNSGNVSVQITFGTERVGDIALEDCTLNVLKSGPASSGPWEVSGLKRGQYALVDLNNGDTKNIRITGDEREAVHVQF